MAELTVGRVQLYLAGFLAAGKSTVGQQLARALEMPFYDLDAHVEARLGKTIERILREEGEAFYRAVEAEILRELSLLPYAVVALGAGTLSNPASRDVIRKSGILIWLQATPETLWNRAVEADRLARLYHPTVDLENLPSAATLRERLVHLLEAREPLYREADVTVETSGLRVEEVVESILEKLRGAGHDFVAGRLQVFQR